MGWREEAQEREETYNRLRDVLDQESSGTLGKDGYVSQDGRRGYRIGRDYDVENTPKKLSDPYYHTGGTPVLFKVAIWFIAMILVFIALSALIHLFQLNVLGYCYC